MRRSIAALLVGATAAGLCACQRARDFLPSTHTVSVAPDGRTRAFVRQHFSIDPPADHLYVVPPAGTPRHLMALAPDQDWSRAIVWSPDSRRVGFLINDQRLAVFDARSFELEAMLLLVSDDSHEARSVTLADSEVSFDVVQRAAVHVSQRDGRVLQAHAAQISRFPSGSRVI